MKNRKFCSLTISSRVLQATSSAPRTWATSREQSWQINRSIKARRSSTTGLEAGMGIGEVAHERGEIVLGPVVRTRAFPYRHPHQKGTSSSSAGASFGMDFSASMMAAPWSMPLFIE